MAKTHIMRWAPMDYRTSRVRARSVQKKDPILRLVYLEALNALHEAGGSLPADPAVLADEFCLPAKEIARCLPILDELSRGGTGRGGIRVEGGRISNGRVTSDLQREEAFRAEQAIYGREGGRQAGKGRPKATPNDDRATPIDPQGGPNPPLSSAVASAVAGASANATTRVVDTSIVVPRPADDDAGDPYVDRVLDLYRRLPGTTGKASSKDRVFAEQLHREGIPLDAVQAGLLTATARRELRHHDEPLRPIGSLAYFRDAILESRETPPEEGYVGYMAGKLGLDLPDG